MPTQVVLSRGVVRVVRYACEAGIGAPAAHEVHEHWNVAWVGRGAFGYRVGRDHQEMVAGSTLVGRAGDEYTCTHDHACGDVCLAIFPHAEWLVEQDWNRSLTRSRGVPPLRRLALAGRLLASAAAREATISVEEAALLYLSALGRELGDMPARRPDVAPATRRRMVASALWIDEHHRRPIDLAAASAEAGHAPHHFLRTFHATLGVTPHQYLIQSRLRAAAAMLGRDDRPIIDVAFASGFADLSNFNRTFRAAFGASPRAFRNMAAGDRKNLQERRPQPN